MTGSTGVDSAIGAPMTGSEASDWHHWCRLCAKEHPDNVNVYFRDGDQTWTSVLAVAIGKYFWVNIKMEDELSNALCRDCYTMVEDLIEFSDRVNRVQTLFAKLQQAGPEAALNYESFRKDCGVPAEEWKHFLSRDQQPVELPVEKTEVVDADDYIVDENGEPFDADTEIMDEIEASELVEEQENEPYESYVEDEDTVEEAEVNHEEISGKEYDENETSDNAQSPLYSKPNVELVDSDATTTTTTTTNEEDIKEAEQSTISATENSQYRCTTCNKSYKKPMAYRRHMAELHGLVPTDMPNLECVRCNIFFATENQLTAHYRTHMPAKDKADNACAYCPKLFTTAGALKRHVMCIHENVKPFICDCCGKGMKTITALNEHKLVHTDECPYECPVCPRRFKNMARLKIHSDTHTKNNYECNICGMKLNTRRTLNMHKLVHTDDKQFKCDVCGAAFKRGKTLKAHLILHTGIRPYKCNFCGKDFANGSNCRMHKRKTHPLELAEEESRGVMRSTLLPMITELTEASKRVKKPAKMGTAIIRSRVVNVKEEDDMEEEEAADGLLYEIVEECP